MSDIEEQFHKSSNERVVSFHFEKSDYAFFYPVAVRQQVDVVKLKLESPQIEWTASHGRSAEIAKLFAGCLNLAIEIAREWDKDTGKDYREVLN